MPEIEKEPIASRPELRHTLWHCRQCAALVAIYSAEIIDLAICPICSDIELDPQGSFEAILGMSSQERSPIAS
jgi:hypothetical protein